MAIVSKAARLAAAGKPFFKCPNCEALYHIVKVEAGPQSADREITCRACGGPLPGREAKFVMKYFLLRKNPAASKNGRGHSVVTGRAADAWFCQDHFFLKQLERSLERLVLHICDQGDRDARLDRNLRSAKRGTAVSGCYLHA